MSDNLRSPNPQPAYEQEPWEQEWIEQNGDQLVEARSRGLEVMHRIKTELPLSPREAAIAHRTHDSSDWEIMRELGLAEHKITRVMAERIGLFLANPDTYIADLSEIAELSDDRPVEPSE